MSKADYEKLFCPTEHGRYFLAHSIGLMPRSTPEIIDQNYLASWRAGSATIWPQWLAAINEFNIALANLFNTNAEQLCPQTNVSSGLSKVLMALPKRRGKRTIVATESDFPSAGFVLQQAEKLGYSIKLIPKKANLQDLATWEMALSKDVHAVFITQVHYNTNLLIAAEEIAELCAARNIISIVDSAQATGIVPIDLSKSKIDVMVGSCIKWLCGGPGAGFIWLNKQRIAELEPYDVGWFSHQDPFEFDLHHFAYADTAARFWGGTPSVVSYIVASNSIQLINQIGVATIAEHNRALTKKLLAAVPEEAIASPKDLTKKGGTTVLKFNQHTAVVKALQDMHILFDTRQYGLRLSPHIYNTEEDIDLLIECLTEYLQKHP